jgi:hypothetical protein
MRQTGHTVQSGGGAGLAELLDLHRWLPRALSFERRGGNATVEAAVCAKFPIYKFPIYS